MNILKNKIAWCLIATASISYSSLSQNDEQIVWSADLEFSWDLFKEKKQSYSYIKAMTYSGIKYAVEVKNDHVIIDVNSYFIYGKSWVMKGYKKPHLLTHEKMHFHIAEIYKRKLDKICDTYRVSYSEFAEKGYEKKLQRDFDRIFDEMDKFQELYDAQTEHGTIQSKQRMWEQKIAALLDK